VRSRAAVTVLLLAFGSALMLPGPSAAKISKYKIDSVKERFSGVAQQNQCTATVTYIQYGASVLAQPGQSGGELRLKGHRGRRGGTLHASGYSGSFEQTGAWRNVPCGSSTALEEGTCNSTFELPLTLEIRAVPVGNQAVRLKFSPFDGSRALGPPFTCGPASYATGLRGDRECFGRIKIRKLRRKHVSVSPQVCQGQLASPEGAAVAMAVDLKVDLTRKG
jgi:hypothetical protein